MISRSMCSLGPVDLLVLRLPEGLVIHESMLLAVHPLVDQSVPPVYVQV